MLHVVTRSITYLAWLGLILAMGCEMTKNTLYKQFEKPCFAPTRMVVLASPLPLEQLGVAQQGILCRIYFFLNENPIPIQVNGDMRFVAYDRLHPNEDGTPIGVYEISAEDMENHRRKDVVGESYVFWLPYQPPTMTHVYIQADFTPRKKHAQPLMKIVTLELEPAASFSQHYVKNGSKQPRGADSPKQAIVGRPGTRPQPGEPGLPTAGNPPNSLPRVVAGPAPRNPDGTNAVAEPPMVSAGSNGLNSPGEGTAAGDGPLLVRPGDGPLVVLPQGEGPGGTSEGTLPNQRIVLPLGNRSAPTVR